MRFRLARVSPGIQHVSRIILGPALALLFGQACIPAVMHGPRIDRGFTTGLAASYTAGPRKTRYDNGGMAYAYGPVGVNAGYGWTSESTDGLGVLLGLHVPVPLVVAAQPDVYVQLPKRAVLGLDAGVGVILVPINETMMPYAQLGALRANGSGVYATYGFFDWPGSFQCELLGPRRRCRCPRHRFPKGERTDDNPFFCNGHNRSRTLVPRGSCELPATRRLVGCERSSSGAPPPQTPVGWRAKISSSDYSTQ